MAARVAAESSAELLSFCCTLAPEVAARRLTLRASAGGDPSDADAAIARQAADRFEMWPGAIPVDTVPPIAARALARRRRDPCRSRPPA